MKNRLYTARKFLTGQFPNNTHLLLAILAVSISPYFLTRSAIFSAIDFTATGQIGDTIGGLTTPIIGLINTWLLIITLRGQNNQIREQADQFKEQRLYTELDRRTDGLKNSIASLKIDISLPNPDNSGFAEKHYLGEETFIIISSMFMGDEKNLSLHAVSPLRWASLMKKVAKILTDSCYLLYKNLVSNTSHTEKELIFLDTMLLISDIFTFYENVETFNQAYPNSPLSKNYAIDLILENKVLVENIKELKPMQD